MRRLAFDTVTHGAALAPTFHCHDRFLPRFAFGTYQERQVKESVTETLDERNIRSVFLLHSDQVVAGIDMVHFAGHAAGEPGQEVQACAADIVDRDIAPQRGVELVPFEDVTEIP